MFTLDTNYQQTRYFIICAVMLAIPLVVNIAVTLGKEIKGPITKMAGSRKVVLIWVTL